MFRGFSVKKKRREKKGKKRKSEKKEGEWNRVKKKRMR